MNILTLTWTGGENNPFEYFNACIRKGLEAFGARCFDIPVDDSFAQRIAEVTRNRIDVAITFQGLYSNLKTTQGKGLWEELGIKLVSLHGDHPCHMPVNHQADSSHVFHLYAAPSWAEYSEKYFSRAHPVFFYMQPNYFRQDIEPAEQRSGRYFVFPKNVDDTIKMKEKWKELFPSPFANFLIMAAEEISINYRAGDPEEHHKLVDNLLTAGRFESFTKLLKAKNEVELFHLTHAMLDKVYRNTVSEAVVEELKDVPLEIYGRGWDRFKASPSRHHTFKDFTNTANGDYQYYSELGVIDVSPVRDFIHDRSARAMANDSGFLSNCQLNFRAMTGDAGNGLFYTGKAGDLRNKAEIVMTDPEAHRARACQFSRTFDQTFSMYGFYSFLASLKT